MGLGDRREGGRGLSLHVWAISPLRVFSHLENGAIIVSTYWPA